MKRSSLHITLALGALVGLAGCGGAQNGAPDPAPRPPAAEPDEVLPTLSCEGLAQELLFAEPTRTGLAARFGAPDSVEVATEPNRHVPGRTDSLFVVHYDGLVSSIRTPSPGRDLPFHVVVTDNRFVRYPAIGIGATPAAVEAVLGPPTRRTDTTVVYECGEGAEEPVTFRLEAGRVERIVIDYYVD